MITLNDLGIAQVRPLLLSVLQNFKPAEVRQALHLMVSWSVRFLIVGKLGSGPLESNYSSLAKDVREGRYTTARQLAKQMQSVVPDDHEFKQSFVAASVSKAQLARYYLRVLENQASGKEEPALVPNRDQQIVNLEHILPQNPSDNWQGFDAETAKPYVKRIGNLALLEARINVAAGNDSFSAKRTLYASSAFELTRSLSQFTAWEPEKIHERQLDLAARAVIAWPQMA
jgi:hypothetical protein